MFSQNTSSLPVIHFIHLQVQTLSIILFRVLNFLSPHAKGIENKKTKINGANDENYDDSCERFL